MSHFLSLVILSVCIATVFALITREERHEQMRYFLKLMAYMLLGSLVVAWIMYVIP